MKPIHLKLILIPVFAILISLVLAEFAKTIAHLLSIDYSGKFEIIVVFGQLAFQFIFIWKQHREKQVSYLFNVMTVSLIGAILLLPLLIWNHYSAVSDMLILIYFFGVVFIMFLDHRRRVKKLELPWYLSYTWVFYRCIVLLLINRTEIM